MTVAELSSMTRTFSTKIILKDAYNGREYHKIDNYLDRKVTGIFAVMYVARDKTFATPAIGAWIEHDFEGR